MGCFVSNKVPLVVFYPFNKKWKVFLNMLFEGRLLLSNFVLFQMVQMDFTFGIFKWLKESFSEIFEKKSLIKKVFMWWVKICQKYLFSCKTCQGITFILCHFAVKCLTFEIFAKKNFPNIFLYKDLTPTVHIHLWSAHWNHMVISSIIQLLILSCCDQASRIVSLLFHTYFMIIHHIFDLKIG